ncbi:TetR/AcrR family transcriptional regulator [Nocardia yamanashiensis]|uniref:TetR/AcrR family transcriptional regulator n=1 Tax=Nocardia yamanashiensis TaxID=209247 RepID=UPI001E3D6237|nr:TetR/AcrR family transcriptional regulator [Nocardia yamanashiensis]UGT43815.1 TetR/AcrR family transcriptional regulator [Nocardia yamanashiensis]
MTADAEPLRKRGRPRATAEEIEARRRKLVVAAYEVFLDKGYHATVIADISAHAGLGFGTFYKAFDSKRQILDAVIDYGVDQLLAEILTPGLVTDATTVTEFEDQFRTVGSRINTVFAEHPRLAKFLALEATTIDDELTTRWFGLVDYATSLVAGYLTRAADQGLLRRDFELEHTARAIVGIILMGILDAARGTGSPNPDAYIHSAVAMITAGLRST